MENPQDRRRSADEDEGQALSSGIEAELCEHFAGFEVLDRSLELAAASGLKEPARSSSKEPALRIDMVGVDHAGRLLLVLIADDADEPMLLAAIEALATARSGAASVLRHLRSSRVRSGARSLVVLLRDTFSPRSLRALSIFPEDELRLFEMRELRSERGARTYLAPVQARGSREPKIATPADLLAGLKERDREVGDLALQRIARIDTDLACSVDETAASWRFRDRLVCSLVRGTDHLEALVPGREERLALRLACDVEALIDDALREHLRIMAGEERVSLSERSPDRGGGKGGVLLTPEEIAAFRD